MDCASVESTDSFFGLRIASIFIILVGSTLGALFPVLSKRSNWLHVPRGVFDFAKYFGSGVIIATAFIHLLSPALDALGSSCLSDAWSEYPYALALCLLSIFSIFVTELIAFRWGTAKLASVGHHHDAHGHASGSHAAHGPEGRVDPDIAPAKSDSSHTDVESGHSHHGHSLLDTALTQILGIAILEFGVTLHSVLIGLTLATDPAFKVLFVVLIFHQTFEGLGLGSRLAYMKLPSRYNYVPILGAVLYGLTTPIGIAAGLGVRTAYNPGSPTALIVSGVLDALSSGILIYTGLVELLAHEFLFNKEMMSASNSTLCYALGSMFSGCALMAVLGKWA